MLNPTKIKWRKLVTGLAMVTAFSFGGAALAEHFIDSGDCCYPGSPCCYPGSPCCRAHHAAAKT
jgi:hypothetical protein